MSYSNAQLKAFKTISARASGAEQRKSLSDITRQMREGDRADLLHKVKVGRLTQTQAEAIFGEPL